MAGGIRGARQPRHTVAACIGPGVGGVTLVFLLSRATRPRVPIIESAVGAPSDGAGDTAVVAVGQQQG
eukprot:2369892-Rhodomonas_salina.1